mgnify:CR=1 FL=1
MSVHVEVKGYLGQGDKGELQCVYSEWNKMYLYGKLNDPCITEAFEIIKMCCWIIQ